MRYERKYRIEGLTPPVIEQVIRYHPAGFRPLHPRRQVNNIYFDTPDLGEFYQNVAGEPLRRKHRLRWYGTRHDPLPHPSFEIKIKDGELGRKETQSLPTTPWRDLRALFSEVPALARLPLRPVLVNQYQRAYWGSRDGRFRITLDWELTFAPFSWAAPSPTLRFTGDPACVLELKYDRENDERARTVFEHLPFRLTKNSKYVTGISLVLA